MKTGYSEIMTLYSPCGGLSFLKQTKYSGRQGQRIAKYCREKQVAIGEIVK